MSTMQLSKQKMAVATACGVMLVGGPYLALKHAGHNIPEPLTQQVDTNLPGYEFGQEMKTKVPGATVPVEAVEFLGTQQSLPGLSKGDHVAFNLPESSIGPDGEFQSKFDAGITYPLTVTVDADVNGEGFLHHYQIKRISQDSPWHLKRAWRTDPAGSLVQEYPIR